MRLPTRVLTIFALCCCMALIASFAPSRGPVSAAPPQPAPPSSPAQGYDIHVVAPHLVDGHEMGPYHHYCKVHDPDPQIVCLIYDSTDPNAKLSQVEWIYAKKLVRNQVSLRDWNKNWHDHAIEIAGGRVKVLDLPDDKATEVAKTVATTDGLIYHFYKNGNLPNGKMSVAQAVGHKPMKQDEWKKGAQ
ncbi:MAG TPA: DUF1264 domain-containing protein [Terriglobales bacterium]|nr:DUF1264 domain-containing protein [Terriglobales bacterium]